MNALPSTRQSRCDPERQESSYPGNGQKPTLAGYCEVREPNGKLNGKRRDSKLNLCTTLPTYADPIPPCHFLKLPTELRQEIFQYLMPDRPIDSLVVYRTVWKDCRSTIVTGGSLRTMLPTPLLDLLLSFNREIYVEIRDVFYKRAIFTIDINNDGVTLCGRRILGPLGRDGYIYRNDDQEAIDRFIRYFAWSAVRNYTINISVGRQEGLHDPRMGTGRRDEEVEMYDLRDYVAVVVSGVLAKARQLHSLQVSVKIKTPDPFSVGAVDDTNLLIGPFERLRRVRKPRLVGVFHAWGPIHTYAHRPRGYLDLRNRCITPPEAEPVPLLIPGMAAFDAFAIDWERCLSSEGPSNMLPKSPMTKLFVEFKTFYNKLVRIMPNVVRLNRQCFLHRARVAREHEDITGFRAVAAELLACWRHHLQLQELERQEVNNILQRMIDADIYPRKE